MWGGGEGRVVMSWALSALLVEIARIGLINLPKTCGGGHVYPRPPGRLRQPFRDLVTEAQSHVLLSFDWCHLHLGSIILFQIWTGPRDLESPVVLWSRD